VRPAYVVVAQAYENQEGRTREVEAEWKVGIRILRRRMGRPAHERHNIGSLRWLLPRRAFHVGMAIVIARYKDSATVPVAGRIARLMCAATHYRESRIGPSLSTISTCLRRINCQNAREVFE